MLAGNEFQSLGRAIVKEDEYEEVRWDDISSGRQHSLKCAKGSWCYPMCTVVQQGELESIPASSYGVQWHSPRITPAISTSSCPVITLITFPSPRV
ncbi:hypothetical protein ANN_07546 [Periplaneta americana]|uniref:Uncharacterized protein n=1 Tax=Periplaneta americana TaxID=6978 RepID=A0ABQ8SYX0_PERAM|nr:hypothetical protein ANN_07546 [Periplaneta americana]